MQRVFSLFILFFLYFVGYAQNIEKRIILFGDAGEINAKQDLLLHHANYLLIEDKSIVFFLGDNVYPNGMGLDGVEKENGIKTLHAQFDLFRNQNVPVYFLAGNHDWNVSRPGGLEKLKAQEDYLKSLNDHNVSLIPRAGELGPLCLEISDDVIAVAYDSEYWLYPYHSPEINIEEQKTLFIEKLIDIFESNSEKTILILSHHPMITYGEHSLSFGWKQHVFPLTRLNKNLYIPLPILGSLYPLWRGEFFKSAEDLPSVEYQSLIQAILRACGDHKNVIFAAGHDHGLQFIENESITQIVSGSGSKTSFILNNKNLKFKFQQQGFCIMDCMEDDSIVISYYVNENDQVKLGYQTKVNKK